jgi:hypothetical protein
MDRRYQVFISSTYTDLAEERREVIQALLEMDCLPAGMEMFPATNEEQWTLIRQVIDESDYYVVIVGGRYGSTTVEGISYTEKEYDYAVEVGKPVLGFVHASPEDISLAKSQPEMQAQLDAFRAKVMSRLVKTYTNPADLGSAVSRSLVVAMKRYPAEGWVRGQFAMTPETTAQMAELRARVSELQLEVKAAASATAEMPVGLASGDDEYFITGSMTFYRKSDIKDGTLKYGSTRYVVDVSVPTTWNDIFGAVAPILMNEASETEFRNLLFRLCENEVKSAPKNFFPRDFGQFHALKLPEELFQDVLVQLFALNLTTHGVKKRSATDRAKYWSLTPLGQDTLMKLRAIPRELAVIGA